MVSEETGAVSYAYNGALVRGVTLEVLRSFLTSVLLPQTKSRNWAGWLRALPGQRVKTGPAVITKTGVET